MSQPNSYSSVIPNVSLQSLEAYVPDLEILEASRARRASKLQWLKDSDSIISESTEYSVVFDEESVGMLSLEKGFEAGSQPWIFISDLEIDYDKRRRGLGLAAVVAAYRHVMKPDLAAYIPSIYSDVDGELFIARLISAGLTGERYDWQSIKDSQLKRRDPKRTQPKELLNIFEVGVILEPLRNMIKSVEI